MGAKTTTAAVVVGMVGWGDIGAYAGTVLAGSIAEGRVTVRDPDDDGSMVTEYVRVADGWRAVVVGGSGYDDGARFTIGGAS